LSVAVSLSIITSFGSWPCMSDMIDSHPQVFKDYS
jgi:hypothetical protein